MSELREGLGIGWAAGAIASAKDILITQKDQSVLTDKERTKVAKAHALLNDVANSILTRTNNRAIKEQEQAVNRVLLVAKRAVHRGTGKYLNELGAALVRLAATKSKQKR